MTPPRRPAPPLPPDPSAAAIACADLLRRAPDGIGLVDARGTHVAVPPALVDVLLRAADRLASGAPPVDDDGGWLRTGQAAAMLGVSRRTLVRLLDDGRLPYDRTGPGGHRRLRRRDVLAHLDDRREDPPASG
ncbi:helix-turn-helix domain-containing protein [Cellulomonas endophytica]|uniref:helix-turn-helix domain-containing protein n=1 Tax=Cellulomonas endophytica TaxID=2494735 RepID=UPI00196A46E7|nr:helix-turn-helix domain-containing protein [Cellulomonas endophytica]